MTASTHLIFVYGSLLPGELHHHILSGSPHLGKAETQPCYRLVELGPFPALIRGRYAIRGELYRIDSEVRRQLDVLKEHPRLFHRAAVELNLDAPQPPAPGLAPAELALVESYMMLEEQVRGRRRLKVSDWRERFARQLPTADWERPRRLR